MARPRIDYIGQVFGKLTVIGDVPSLPQKRRIIVRCDCGTQKEVSLYAVTRGDTTSCGCWNSDSKRTHGATNTRLYRIWASMKQRCTDTKNKAYPDYGGRGISFIPEWGSYENFRDWALVTGYTPQLSIDRIDNQSNYSPSNCRWVNSQIQATNRRKRSNTASQYIGVSKWSVKGQKAWVANISVNKKSIYLGKFPTELEAAKAREAYIDNHGLVNYTRNNL